jgi:hypothetical protein
MMAALCRHAGMEYFHFLQPNQYVQGSKTLSDDELASAWAPDRDWSRAAREGYPLARQAGLELVDQGIRFHDLTQVFADHPETIYVDSCCHFNRHGCDLVAAAIAAVVAPELAGAMGGDGIVGG